MTSIIIIAVFLIIYGLYSILKKETTISIGTVLAGDISGEKYTPIHNTIQPRKVSTLFSKYTCNGEVINPNKYMLMKVAGGCMSPNGIHNGDIVFIKTFTSEKEKKEVKPGDIIMLKTSTRDGYKLREFDSWIPDENGAETNTAKLKYYGKETMWANSGRGYDTSFFVGKIDMVLIPPSD
jgi:hypothetical protein